MKTIFTLPLLQNFVARQVAALVILFGSGNKAFIK